MPIYEYQCRSCHHQFDALQKTNDTPLTHCPECNKETLEKLISASSFQLKGTGWYATDFKDKKPAAKNDNNAEKTDKDKNAVPTDKNENSNETKNIAKNTEQKPSKSDNGEAA